MFPASPRTGRGLSLTLRLSLALTVASCFVALLVAFLGADRRMRDELRAEAVHQREFATQFAERIAPLLDREDLLRLSMLATAGRDFASARVLVLDRGGRVVLDSALVQGERQLGLLTLGGAFQRTIDQAGEQLRETLVPVRFGGEAIGEVRFQTARSQLTAAFDFGLFALVWLGCVSLVAVAALMGHHWSARVRSVTDSLVQLATGQLTSPPAGPDCGELRELGAALHELEKGVHDGLHRVVDGYVAMALQVVDGLERRGLVPPGHGERTARYALQLADRVELLAADRQDLELACRLQDLGKAWVRPAVLQKKDPTPAELAALRDHPVQAAEQLECLPGLRRAADIVRHQLEQQDGCGHPDALRGERIPIGARILAIASAFDLLTSCGERRSLSCEAALGQLQEGRGEIFDPWLLDLFADIQQRTPPELHSDRPVMILPSGSMPVTHRHQDDEAGLDYDLGAQLDLMLEKLPEEQPEEDKT